MKKIISIVILTTVAVFAAACADSTSTNTANTTSNKNIVSANSGNSNSMPQGNHRMNEMNGNHSQMGNQQMPKGMNMRAENEK